MTIREKLKLMEEIKRKNDAAFAEEARRRKVQPCRGKRVMHEAAVLMLDGLITFVVVILMGVVALLA